MIRPRCTPPCERWDGEVGKLDCSQTPSYGTREWSRDPLLRL